MTGQDLPIGSGRWKVALLIALAMAISGVLAWSAWPPPSRRPAGTGPDFEITQLAVPLPAPDLRMEIRDGQPFSLADSRGQVLLVNFWATWCPPCREEMPSMAALGEQLQRQYPGKFKLLAVSVDEGWDPIRKYFGRSPPPGLLVGLDRDQMTTRAYYCTARGGCPGSYKFPESYIIDRQGRLVAYIVGSRDWSRPEPRRFLQQLIGG